MKTHGKSLMASVLLLSFSWLAASAPAEAVTARHAGLVIAVDKTAGTIVVGEMGPKLPSGESKIARFTIRVTPSTEFVRVKRVSDMAPSGWLGDYVENKLPAWDVKPGDWVTATVQGGRERPAAVKVTVVDTTEP